MRRTSSDERPRVPRSARIRFHGELVGLLRAGLRRQPVELPIAQGATLKHAIETLDVPHTELGEIRVDGQPVALDRILAGGESIDAYPARADANAATGRAPSPGPDVPARGARAPDWREARFLADAHLGALARRLRLLGFDTALAGDGADHALAERAQAEARILLSRDRELLKHRRVLRGRLVRSTDPDDQLDEVLERYALKNALRPFSRCLECNAPLRPVERALVADRLPPSVAAGHTAFTKCDGCGRIYWPGSHWSRLRARVEAIRRRLERA